MIACSKKTLSRALAAAFGLALTFAGANARGDDQQRAEELFDEGRRLMRSRATIDKACSTLEESLRLWDRGDTVLNLALCHRLQGKTATAWIEFDRAVSHGIKVRFPEAILEAKKQRAELATKLSRLTVTVPPKLETLEGLSVEVDGKAWPRQRWNVASPADPGPLRVTAQAKGHKPFEAKVVLGPNKDTKTVVVALEVEPPSPPPPPPPRPVTKPRPVWPWVVGSSGIVLGAAALGAEIMSVLAHNELDTECKPHRRACRLGYDFGPVRTRELAGFGLFLGLGAAAVVAVGAAGVGFVLPSLGQKQGVSLMVSPTSVGLQMSF